MNLEERPAANTKLIAGRLCLDFVNTVGGRNPGAGKKSTVEYVIRDERILDFSDLVAWAWHVQLITEKDARSLIKQAQSDPVEASAVLNRGIQLREAVYRISRAIVRKYSPSDSDLDVVNQEMQKAFDRMRLISGEKNLRWEWPSTHSLERILWPIVDSAVKMFTTGDLTRLRQCSGEDCGWLFEDTSRNRSRQWCDMQDCGNIAKVRRFRKRKRG